MDARRGPRWDSHTSPAWIDPPSPTGSPTVEVLILLPFYQRFCVRTPFPNLKGKKKKGRAPRGWSCIHFLIKEVSLLSIAFTGLSKSSIHTTHIFQKYFWPEEWLSPPLAQCISSGNLMASKQLEMNESKPHPQPPRCSFPSESLSEAVAASRPGLGTDPIGLRAPLASNSWESLLCMTSSLSEG